MGSTILKVKTYVPAPSSDFTAASMMTMLWLLTLQGFHWQGDHPRYPFQALVQVVQGDRSHGGDRFMVYRSLFYFSPWEICSI